MSLPNVFEIGQIDQTIAGQHPVIDVLQEIGHQETVQDLCDVIIVTGTFELKENGCVFKWFEKRRNVT